LICGDENGDGALGILLEGVLDEVEEDLGPIKKVPTYLQGGGSVQDLRLLFFDDEFEPLNDIIQAISEGKGGDF